LISVKAIRFRQRQQGSAIRKSKARQNLNNNNGGSTFANELSRNGGVDFL
jgi:hypothetical protein